MNENSIPSPPPRRGGGLKILREAVCLAIIGAAFAFIANGISPRGLALTRNYFPTGTGNGMAPPPAIQFPGLATGTNQQSAALAARLKEAGLQLADGPLAEQLFRDPRYGQGLVVFIDARDSEHYEAGHIRGAVQFNPYHPEQYLAAVLPLCSAAEQVVVYCNGGSCEDSQFAAITLRDAGIAPQKIFVYGGGITEWTDKKLPVTTGTEPGDKTKSQ